MGINTKLKILRTAAREFAENGYRKTTIRTICQKAAVNVAAVNYHFSGKSELYCQTLDWLMEAICGNEFVISKDKSPRENIRLWVSECIQLRATGRTWQNELALKMVFHELQGPSDNYDYFYQSRILPDLEILRDSIIRGLGRDISETEVKIRLFALIGKAIFYVFHKNVVEQFGGIDFLKKNQEKIIESIVAEATNDFID